MATFEEFYKCILFGDSISRGVIFDEIKEKYVTIENSFAAIVESRFNGFVVNCARFGNTIIRGFSRFQAEIKKNNPDIALIEFGGNDCDFNWEKIAESPSATHSPKTDINEFRQTLQELVEQLKSVEIIPVLLTIPPIDADRYLDWVSKFNADVKESIMQWLDSVTKIYWWQERYNAAIISVAEKTQARWIDIREAFLRTPDYRQFICKDGIHPNAKGHELIAAKILEYISSKYKYLMADS